MKALEDLGVARGVLKPEWGPPCTKVMYWPTGQERPKILGEYLPAKGWGLVGNTLKEARTGLEAEEVMMCYRRKVGI